MLHTSAQSITAAIMEQVNALPTTLLGWDGSTEKELVLDNLKNYIHRYCGWELLCVTVENGILEIKEPNSLLLSYNIKTGQEIYGRVRHMGLTGQMISELKYLI